MKTEIKSKPMKSFQNRFMFFTSIILLLFSQFDAIAQEEAETFTAKNSIFVDLKANALQHAVNYGRIIHQNNKLKIAASVGFSLRYRQPSEPIHSGYLTPVIPAEITAFLGRDKHHFEFGAGFFTILNRRFLLDPDQAGELQEKTYWDSFVMARIGYRYQKPEGGFFYRVGYTPTLAFYNSGISENPIQFFPFGLGISLGKSF
ncbi:hypothetical protein [Belliella aquatica]|uniref:DUF3575 domain-containing protein n=1 Tax=Belliella aquatica TaxID=1323734 RepID=A0ABQ1MRT6_9BACT|nr:hypothetical protein [Belliella aquatica]MCH7405981.1 hypothetical protein [Belliella aquatica]GGC43660.1 hypothetical protein GCM10010993_22690 [Belliella aquatica]